MLPTPGQSLLTAEEFAGLPQPKDGSQQELVNGVIVTMPPPSFYHGRCCNRIGKKLGNHVDDQNLGFVTNNDSGVILSRDPDTVRVPDVAYWSKERLTEPPRNSYPTVAPDLAIEVLSPSDIYATVTRKIQQYLKAGVRMVWILVPEDRSIEVYRPNGSILHLDNGDTISGEEVLPGFTSSVAELFP